jgi:TPR repeat protein
MIQRTFSAVALAAMVVLAFSVSTVPTAGDELDRAKQSLERVREQGWRGDINAQFVLGFMYQEGKTLGVPQDYAEAAKWYRLAADQGYYAAMHELGFLYFEGKGVPQDYVTAYMWLNLAAARSPAGETNAAEDRDLVASRMTRAQIAEGQKLAQEWVPR